MSFFHKKKATTKANAANVHMTEAEAALAQSDFNIDKILEIQNKFAGGTALLVPGRIFIREGMLWKVCRKGPKKRQFFLFNDILVSGDPSYQPELKTTFNTETLDEQLDIHNAFQISHANKSFHVFSLSQADKANWLANLQKHINKVALVGGNQTVAPRAVWVPDSCSKECMICGQKFSAFNRKHHCRQCGRVVCSTCSPHRVIIDPQTEGKPERACSECVKDVAAVKSKGSPELQAKDQPAAVAAQLVSNALRHNSDHRPAPPPEQSPRQRRDSTDTEDSDDSEREEDSPPSKKKPTPTPRRTQSELRKTPVSPTPMSSSPPRRPPPYGSVRRPPPPTNPDTPSSPVSSSVKKESPKPKPRAKKPEQPSLAPSDPGAEGTSEGVSERVSAEVISDEPQPTPPPRKRKKAKLRQQIEEQLKNQLQVTPTTTQPSEQATPTATQLSEQATPTTTQLLAQQTKENEDGAERETESAEEVKVQADGIEAQEGDESVEVVNTIDREQEEEENEEGGDVVAYVSGEIDEVEVAEVTTGPAEEEEEEEAREGSSAGYEETGGEEGEERQVEGEEREGEGKRAKKHFSDAEDSKTSDSTHDENEATPTDSTHHKDDATPTVPTAADQETISDNVAESETEPVSGQEINPGSGQEESGQHSSLPTETTEDGAPVKKPRGRRQKFKQAES